MAAKQKIIKPKEFSYNEAYEIAKKDSNVEIISMVTKDRYRIENVDKKIKIKVYGSAINGWQNGTFILTDELVGGWIIKKNDVVMTEVTTE